LCFCELVVNYSFKSLTQKRGRIGYNPSRAAKAATIEQTKQNYGNLI